MYNKVPATYSTTLPPLADARSVPGIVNAVEAAHTCLLFSSAKISNHPLPLMWPQPSSRTLAACHALCVKISTLLSQCCSYSVSTPHESFIRFRTIQLGQRAYPPPPFQLGQHAHLPPHLHLGQRAQLNNKLKFVFLVGILTVKHF